MTNNEANFLSGYSQFLDASGEHLNYSALSIYRNFSGELSEKEKIFFKNHLNSCSACSAWLREIEEVEGEEQTNPPIRILNLQSLLIRYAIAAMLVVGFGLTIFFTVMQQNRDNTQPQQVEMSIAEAVQDPDSFLPNKTLENFIDRTIRSSREIQFLVPENGDTLKSPFTFQWKTAKPHVVYTIIIVDNKNVELLVESVSTEKITIQKELAPGVYYMKLNVDGDLMHVRKFFILQ